MAEINGTDGDDQLIGGVGGDTLLGGAGNDTLDGSAAFTFAAYYTSASAVAVQLFDGNVFNDGLGGQDRLTNIYAVIGSAFDDIVLGSTFGDVVIGLDGNDSIQSLDGDDLLRGNAGNDEIDGGNGTDTVVYSGNRSDYTVTATSTGFIIADTRSGSDTDGTDAVANVEVFQFANGNVAVADLLDSAAGPIGTPGPDTLSGGVGADTISGLAGNDSLFGFAGDDTLDGGAGADRLYGGTGNDTFLVDTRADVVFEFLDQGIDTVIAAGSFYLYANIENLVLATGAGAIFGVGNTLSNSLTGNESGNTLNAGDGNDTILGNAGNDILRGGNGDDSMDGGADSDYLAGGFGNDTLRGGLNGDNLYGEDGDDSLSGGSDFRFDRLVGGIGNDTLDGASGFGDFDHLYGNAGDDTFFVDTPTDLVFEQLNEGTDTVFANIVGSGYTLYGNIENLTLQGTTPSGVGNALANTLTGSAAVNKLLGGLGDDTINGMGGNDVLFGQGGADTFVFERGTGRDVIGDFTVGTDKILLSGLGFGSFDQVLAATRQNGASCVVDFGLTEYVILQNVAKASLSADDFVFA